LTTDDGPGLRAAAGPCYVSAEKLKWAYKWTSVLGSKDRRCTNGAASGSDIGSIDQVFKLCSPSDHTAEYDVGSCMQRGRRRRRRRRRVY